MLNTLAVINRPVIIIANGFEIASGLTVERLSGEDLLKVDKLHKNLKTAIGDASLTFTKKKEINNDSFRLLEDLPMDEWKYGCVRSNNNAIDIEEISAVSVLMDEDISFSVRLFNFDNKHEGNSVDPMGIQKLEWHRARNQSDLVIDGKYCEDLKSLYSAYKNIDKKGPRSFVYRSISWYQNVYRHELPDPFKIVILMSALEMLLSHKPSHKSGYDSLNHQIPAKMSYLSNSNLINIKQGLKLSQIDKEKLWKDIYDLRSSYAHGSEVTFENKMQYLQSDTNVLEYLDMSAKALMRYAMVNTNSLHYLRNC